MFREGGQQYFHPLIDAMKSRLFINLCLSLLLLCAQQFAFAGALAHVQQTAFDHQCSVVEGDAADGKLSKHLLIDEYDDGPQPVFIMPINLSVASSCDTWVCEPLFQLVSPHYSSRAPPLV